LQSALETDLFFNFVANLSECNILNGVGDAAAANIGSFSLAGR